MNHRERYLAALLFEKPDRIPFMPGYPRESTLRAWHQQGLPDNMDYMEALFAELGLAYEKQELVWIEASMELMPYFEEKVLEHVDGHYIVQDFMGAIVEISDEFDYTYLREARDFVTRKWHKFPVETREDWERMKERFVVDAPGRFPANFAQQCTALQERDSVLTLQVVGPFWQLRDWCGFENLCTFFIEDPEFVQEMIDFWTDFTVQIIERVNRHITADRLASDEDMAYKAHSMISPAMTRQFLLPTYQRWVSMMKSVGCPLIDMDSDGYIGELIPIWIDAGINVCDPIEVAAHNDIVAFRNQFGTRMAYTGGIDKRAIAAGGKVMEDEMMRVIPPLLKEGGFIPGCDHGVPSDISWPNFVAYSRLLAQLCGWL